MEQDNLAGIPTFFNAGSNGLENEVGESQGVVEIGAGEIRTAEDEAMANPVILSNVFSHLEVPALVNLRLVCKVWDEVITMSLEFHKMYWIHVQRLFPCCTIAAVPKINPNLVKNIYITNACKNEVGEEEHFPKQRKKAAKYNLTTFFNQYHHYVENIKFAGQYCDSFHTCLVNAIMVLDFPKLQGVEALDMFNTDSTFGYPWGWDVYNRDHISTFSTFSLRPNLTSLQLDNTVAGSPFHDIFQKLINCAPNLEEITIRGNFYPDLSNCKNLKILYYSGIPYYYDGMKRLSEEQSFNLKSLSKMLDQAKHSLLRLSLEDSYLCCTYFDWDFQSQLNELEFKLPDVVKNLEFLSIQDTDRKQFFLPELKNLNPIQFPKLKDLCIAMEDLDNVLEGIPHTFGSISSLQLSGGISPDIRHRIPIIFPNLTSLTMRWSVVTGDGKPDFDEVIDFCNGWKLRKLNISTALQFDWSAFMAGLGRLKKAQNDLRMLVLRSRNDGSEKESESMFEVWYDSKKQQQPVTVNVDIENLIFSPQSMKKAMEGAVLECILKHPVKVHFL